MPGTLDLVRRAIQRDGLIPPGSRVLAAVSGGSDSVALLLALRDLALPLSFEIVGLAHLNHHLRGAESDADEAYCRALGSLLGLPCAAGHAEVRRDAAAARVSIEVAARRARYRFLEQAAAATGADLVATGHTRDDQAETVLLQLFRGAGRRGLSGIPPRRGRFIRPLLDVGRAELRAFLADRAVDFREDSTNADRSIPRNWIRHDLIPLLDSRLGRNLTATLSRQARLLRDEDALLDSQAADALTVVVQSRGRDRWLLESAALRRLPRALARRVLRLVTESLGVQPRPGTRQIEAVLEMAEDASAPAAADLPGLRVERNGESVVLLSRERRRVAPAPSFRYDWQVPGRLVAADHGFALEARQMEAPVQPTDLKRLARDPFVAYIDATAAANGLSVRSRWPGDAFVPLGMHGRKKLQDVCVDRKVPRAWRDRLPVVVDRDGRILWVAGVVQSEHGKVTDRTQSVVILRLSRLGDWV